MSDHLPQAPSPEHLAELLPQYAIDSFIAQGGMGAVYRGRQVSLDRDVAIKVLLYEFGEDTEFLKSFTTEAKAMARLSHSNLLGVFDYGNVDGMPYIVMEYVEGGSLHEAAWNKVIDPIQATIIINGICAGLAHAHEHGIVHRDIKPANILLTLKAVPKVGDFGLAHASDSDQTGLVMGTPGYTAPEVFNDPDQAGQLADIYSVGVILHQLLTGIDPAGIVEPPTEPTGNLHLDAIWRKATHITPSERYASIAEMGSALEKWSTAKQKVLVASDAAPFQARALPVQAKVSSIGGKVVIMVILLAAIGLIYQLTGEKKQEIKDGIADDIADDIAEVNANGATPDPKPIAEVKPDLDPVTIPPIRVQSSPMPDPRIVDVGPRDEPVIPPVVISKPEADPRVSAYLPPGDQVLRKRAIGLILKARKKRDKDLSQQHVSKEKAIDRAYLSAITVIRDAYATRLEKAASETSDAQLKPRLLAQAGRAKDLDAWIGLLSPETKRLSSKLPSKPVPKKNTAGFVGKWDHTSNGKSSLRIAHPDGRFEVVGKDWKVTWEILKDGTLKLDSGKIRPSILTRDGDGWTGEGPFGQDLSLKRGD
ncbi:MAG: serine/threonine protein kinase [Cryomorphaceae bacterium]|jgi:serine/threonine protein kinase